MNKNILVVITLTLLFIVSSSFIIFKHSSGEVGVTGSPGEGTCANCHSGGSGLTTVSITGNPTFTNNEYVPSQTYTVTVTVSNSNFSNFGFDCEILNTSNTNAGNMTTPLSGVKFLNSGGRKNATHNATKSGAGSAAFSFVWVAPVSGTAIVYATGNAVNGNGNTGGDAPGITSLTLTENTSAAIKETSQLISQIIVFPNPVVSDFSISYVKHNNGKVEACLYDIQGKLVYELFNEHQVPGNYLKNSRLPEYISKGVYFIHFKLNETFILKRLLVVR